MRLIKGAAITDPGLRRRASVAIESYTTDEEARAASRVAAFSACNCSNTDELPEERGFGDEPLLGRRDPTRWKAWRWRLLSKPRTWRERENGEEEKHMDTRWCAVIFHDNEQRNCRQWRNREQQTPSLEV
jgi:hypothetical protein